MIRNHEMYMICIFYAAMGLTLFLFAGKRLFRNEELFTYTPSHDEKNVMEKHQLIWVRLGYLNGLPIVFMLMHTFFDKYANDTVYNIYYNIISQFFFPIAFVFVILIATRGYLIFHFARTSHIITRYMVYPAPFELSVILSGISAAIISTVATAGFIILGGDISTVSVLNKGVTGIILFVLEGMILLYANYVVLRLFNDTPREVVLNDLPEADYDKAARRYYGIWRNRLLLVNLVAGAQLILGGYVTMTESGDHLMTLRIVGLAIVSAFFTYVFIQGRNFENPIVVKGMVYPSEKKRVALKWATLIASALYIIAILIFA